MADCGKLSEEQLQRYQGCYCGLCHCIGQRHGTLQRAALNYDMTFLVLLLSSLYEPDEAVQSSRCAVHPFHSHHQWLTEATQYAADINVALAYHNCMDDWHDDRKIKSLFLAELFHSSALSVAENHPTQWWAIQTCMERLNQIEAKNLQDPDAGANAFGALMGTLFVWRDDRWAPLLRQMGEALGRFIYLMDAILDLDEDLKRGSYNPLRSRAEAGLTKEDFLPILKLMIGECTAAFEKLPLLQDLDLLRNILYSGVWGRFYQNNNRSAKEEYHV